MMSNATPHTNRRNWFWTVEPKFLRSFVSASSAAAHVVCDVCFSRDSRAHILIPLLGGPTKQVCMSASLCFVPRFTSGQTYDTKWKTCRGSL
jgi:hypothetical protein